MIQIIGKKTFLGIALTVIFMASTCHQSFALTEKICVSKLFIEIETDSFCEPQGNNVATLQEQNHTDSLASLLSTMRSNIFQLDVDGNNGWGGVPSEWKQQEKLKKIATDIELDSLARLASIPAVRVAAFHALVCKRSSRCYDILISELKDDELLRIGLDDIIWKDNVAHLMLELSTKANLFSDVQLRQLDSLMVFMPGINHINLSESITRLASTIDLYSRIHELYLEGHTYLLPALAEYKRPEDVKLIIAALMEFHKGLDKEGALVRGGEGEGATNDALVALMKWRDNAFIPALEQLRDHELNRTYIDSYRVKMLFKVVMAYNNEWAYHFIEDLLKRCHDDKKFYAIYLYAAYHEEEEALTRFLPLVERYWGKTTN